MRVEGRENVWAIGDAAAVPDPAKRRAGALPADRPARDAPGTAGGRERGRRARAARSRSRFRYRTLGVFVDMGQHKAVAHDARRAAARLPGLVRGAHLPPGDDAGHGAPGAARDSTGPSACSSAARPPSSGQLGPPGRARARRVEEEQPRESGERRSPFREGTRRATCAPTFELGEAALDALAQGARPAAGATTSATADDLDEPLAARARRCSSSSPPRPTAAF